MALSTNAIAFIRYSVQRRGGIRQTLLPYAKEKGFDASQPSVVGFLFDMMLKAGRMCVEEGNEKAPALLDELSANRDESMRVIVDALGFNEEAN